MKHLRIEASILFFTIILILSVIGIGTITFKNLTTIERQSELIYKPNRTIFTLKLLYSNLREAENSIRSYGLYKKPEYLVSYQNSILQIDQCFDSLYFYQKNDPGTIALLDSTAGLTDQKISLLFKEISVKNEEEFTNELNKINIKLNKVSRADTLIVTSKKEESAKRTNFFAKLFNHKEIKSDTASKRDSLRTVMNMKYLKDVKQEISAVKKNQVAMFAEIHKQEFALIQEDKAIWQKLQNILSLLENKQTARLKTLALENIRQTNKTHKLTEAFGILILLLVSFIIIFSIYYFYTGRKYRSQLSSALNEAKLLAKARENFLNTMTHEMRTPLNAVIGFAEQLENSPLNSEQQKQLAIVNSASKHLLNLINDVLDLSKIEAEKICFEKIPFNPIEQIQEAYDILKPAILNGHIKTHLNISSEIPPNLIGDPMRLKQVALNLLSNSIKFTKNGYVRMAVSISPNKTINLGVITLAIIVEDTGIGISENMLEGIFENFKQADPSIARKYGGSGLGLSITKKIVELQGGEIKIESEINKGSKVTVEIPFALNTKDANPLKFEDETYLPELPTGKKILIADDEAFNRALLTTILKRWGFNYEEATNGKEVVEKLRGNDYDLILMDVRMPEMSGIEAAFEIRKMSSRLKASIPIIGITAVTSLEKKVLCLKAGMNDLITKPYKEKELVQTIEKILKN